MANREGVDVVQHKWRCQLLGDDELAGRSVLVMGPEAPWPLIKGRGGRDSVDLLCGSCDRPLATGIEASMLTRVAIRCRCGAANDTDLV